MIHCNAFYANPTEATQSEGTIAQLMIKAREREVGPLEPTDDVRIEKKRLEREAARKAIVSYLREHYTWRDLAQISRAVGISNCSAARLCNGLMIKGVIEKRKHSRMGGPSGQRKQINRMTYRAIRGGN